MRQQILLITSVVFLVTSAWPFAASGQDKVDPTEASYEITKSFWNEYVAEQLAKKQEREKNYIKAWQILKKEHQSKQRALEQEEIDRLLAARARYERAIADKLRSESIPFSLLNLAQINALLASVESSRGGSGSSEYETYLSKALETVVDLEKEFPDFELIDQALYLKATLYEDVEKPKEAYAAWKKLAEKNKATLPVIHANIAAGDFLFNNEDPKASLPFYQRARVLNAESNYKTKDWDQFRTLYRIAWSSYRAAQIELAITTSITILETPTTFGHLEEVEKIISDAVEILGDALYERNNSTYTISILKKQSINSLSPRVALRLLSRSMAHNLYEDAIEFSDVAMKVSPLALEVPALLRINALANDKAGNTLEKILTLEQLALLLPADSLWLSKNEIEFTASQEMKRLAVKAGRIVAAYHYEQGLATGKRASFNTAASFLEILLKYRPTHSSAANWRLRLAHCAYLSGNLDKADRLYSNIRDDNRSDTASSEVASYQLVMSREKIWRNGFGEVASEDKDPSKDPQVLGALNRLQTAAVAFANRFPDSIRSIDLLLLVAASNRDHMRYHSATQLWKRAMVSNPTPSQRMTAIRGIVYSSVQSDAPSKIVQTTADILRLENWLVLGRPLKTELLGVLSSAAETEGERLRKEGEVKKAATVLVQTAVEFSSIPKRQQIWRDGAYLYAIGGDWVSAHAASRDYLDKGLKKFGGDLTYLKARSLEYQMRFNESASEFLQFAKKYPKHRKSGTALWRAYRLADAENIHLVAGMAMRLLADRTKKSSKRHDRYTQAISHFETIYAWERALETAQKQKAISKTTEQGLRSRINVAKIRYAAGQESIALNEYVGIARAIRSKKSNLGNRYGPLLSEVEFAIAREAIAQFNDYNVFERGDQLVRNINTKTGYFDSLAKKLDAIARLEDPRWAAEARYHVAVSAERLANDTLKARNLYSKKLTSKSSSALESIGSKLRRMAKRYFSDNLIARSKRPSAYRSNEWIKRSAIRLANYQEVDYKPQHETELQASASFDIPQGWSL